MREEDVDYGDAICADLSKMCMGDRDTSYTYAYLWVCVHESKVYTWTCEQLYGEIIVKSQK